MGGDTQRILLTFILIFSACTFGLFMLSTIGSRWFSCRSGNTNHFSLIFTLWQFCERQTDGSYLCSYIDEAPKFYKVFFDFKILRALLIICDVMSGSLLLSTILYCSIHGRKFCRKVVIFQSLTAILTVVFGLSSLVYGAARAQDIVGPNVQFTYGWSCVIGWIATIIAFLNAIMTLVLICIYLDHLTEQMIQVREDLGMDTISINSGIIHDIDQITPLPESPPAVRYCCQNNSIIVPPETPPTVNSQSENNENPLKEIQTTPREQQPDLNLEKEVSQTSNSSESSSVVVNENEDTQDSIEYGLIEDQVEGNERSSVQTNVTNAEYSKQETVETEINGSTKAEKISFVQNPVEIIEIKIENELKSVSGNDSKIT